MDQIGLVFPGQGSQAAGMGLEVYEELAEARSLLKRANDTLGFDIGKIMFGSSNEALKPTEIAQPAIFICSAMYLEKYKLLKMPYMAVAGHSLGEYSALYAAGTISFEDGVNLTRKRGLAMSRSTDAECGMAAIIGLSVDQVSAVISRFSDLYVANENSRIQTVISGEAEQLRKACKMFEEMGASKVVELAVSTAFHTPFMKQAKEEMELEIEKAEFKEPGCYLIPNVTAKPTKDTSEIKKALIEQITGKVRWFESFMVFKDLGISKVYEIGHGDVLKKLGMTITTKVKVSPVL